MKRTGHGDQGTAEVNADDQSAPILEQRDKEERISSPARMRPNEGLSKGL
jgi:hypothetical protein